MGGSSTPQVPAAPTPTPPVTPNNAASIAVEQATYRQQLRRKGIGQTVFAGSKGSWSNAAGLQGYSAGMVPPGAAPTGSIGSGSLSGGTMTGGGSSAGGSYSSGIQPLK